MIVIGEKLNSSIPATLAAMQARDTAAITDLILSQQAGGAQYLDINTAICQEEELAVMQWVIALVKKNSSCGIMLDSPSTDVILGALDACEGRDVILNSVTLSERIDVLLPVAKQRGCGLVGLPIDASGMPQGAAGRVENAKALVSRMTEGGLSPDQIYIDVLAEALAVGSENAKHAIQAASQLRALWPDIHIMCGLSNISFGLPKRASVNTAFLAMMMASGMDAAILDSAAGSMQLALHTCEALLGYDEFCMEYITYIREQNEA